MQATLHYFDLNHFLTKGEEKINMEAQPLAVIKTNKYATASWILSIVAIPLFFLFFIGAICSILAIIFGIIALVQIGKSGGTQKGQAGAIIGIVVAALGLCSLPFLTISILALLGPAIQNIFQNIVTNI